MTFIGLFSLKRVLCRPFASSQSFPSQSDLNIIRRNLFPRLTCPLLFPFSSFPFLPFCSLDIKGTVDSFCSSLTKTSRHHELHEAPCVSVCLPHDKGRTESRFSVNLRQPLSYHLLCAARAMTRWCPYALSWIYPCGLLGPSAERDGR